MRNRLIWQVFITMLKIGCFTFGGGYAMLALLENTFIEEKKWIEKEEFLNMVGIAESTPGPIAINSATYLGYRVAGWQGAVAGTVGVCLPSVVIIYAISLFLDAFLSLTIVGYAFRGIQACVIYLIASAGCKMLREMEKSIFGWFLFWIVFSSMLLFSVLSVRFSSVYYVLLSGTIGVLAYRIQKIRQK